MSDDNNPDRDVVAIERGGSSLGTIIGVILSTWNCRLNVEPPTAAPEGS